MYHRAHTTSRIAFAMLATVSLACDVLATHADTSTYGGAAIRAVDVFDPRDFGAFGDGTVHTVQATLGLTTLSGLAAYTASNGKKPYAFVASGYPFGKIVNARVSANFVAGATSLTHVVTQTVGLRFKPGLVARGTAVPKITTYGLTHGTGVSGPCLPNGDTVVHAFGGSIQLAAPTTSGCTTATTDIWTFAQASPGFGAIPRVGNAVGATTLSTYYTTGIDQIPASTPTGVSGNGLAAGSTVQGATCSASTNTCTMNNLSPAPTAAVGTYQTAILAASFTLYLQDTTGVEQGMTMACPGGQVAAGTQVDWVNKSTHELRLSKITAGLVPGGTACTFSYDGLAQVTAGWQVLANGVPTGETTSGPASNGVVPLTLATTGALSATAPTDAPTPVNDGALITYFRPWTDAEAAAMSMDQLGENAAIAAATANLSTNGATSKACGATVHTPSGRYEIDWSIVVPLYWQFASSQCQVHFVGDGRESTFFEATQDVGLDVALLSTGDPSADVTNLRGTYANAGANFTFGQFRDFTVQANRIAISVTHLTGTRPKWGGAPVGAIGVRQGARRNEAYIHVRDFNIGDFFGQDDHTSWDEVQLDNNFIGFRIGQANGALFGDNLWNRVEFRGNDFADISVAWNGYIDGAILNPHIAYAPYAILCEAGAGAGSCFAKAAFIGKPNLEQNGCNIVRDGGRRPDAAGSGANRGAGTLVFDNLFTSRDITFQPAGGCVWSAYVDLFSVGEFVIDRIGGDAWQPISVAGFPGAPLMLVDRIGESGGYAGPGSGSVLLRGDGLSTLFASYAAQGQSLVAGYNGTNGNFFYTSAYQRVAFEIPGMGLRAKLLPILTQATSLPKGAVLEFATSNGHLQAQPFGQGTASGTPTGVLAGLSLQSLLSPAGKFVPVQVRGSEAPVAVSAAAAVGTLLYPPAANTTSTASSTAGQATTTQPTSTTSPIGIVSDANGGSASQVYVTTLGN